VHVVPFLPPPPRPRTSRRRTHWSAVWRLGLRPRAALLAAARHLARWPDSLPARSSATASDFRLIKISVRAAPLAGPAPATSRARRTACLADSSACPSRLPRLRPSAGTCDASSSASTAAGRASPRQRVGRGAASPPRARPRAYCFETHTPPSRAWALACARYCHKFPGGVTAPTPRQATTRPCIPGADPAAVVGAVAGIATRDAGSAQGRLGRLGRRRRRGARGASGPAAALAARVAGRRPQGCHGRRSDPRRGHLTTPVRSGLPVSPGRDGRAATARTPRVGAGNAAPCHSGRGWPRRRPWPRTRPRRSAGASAASRVCWASVAHGACITIHLGQQSPPARRRTCRAWRGTCLAAPPRDEDGQRCVLEAPTVRPHPASSSVRCACCAQIRSSAFSAACSSEPQRRASHYDRGHVGVARAVSSSSASSQKLRSGAAGVSGHDFAPSAACTPAIPGGRSTFWYSMS
jgi:hypothetical protein